MEAPANDDVGCGPATALKHSLWLQLSAQSPLQAEVRAQILAAARRFRDQGYDEKMLLELLWPCMFVGDRDACTTAIAEIDAFVTSALDQRLPMAIGADSWTLHDAHMLIFEIAQEILYFMPAQARVLGVVTRLGAYLLLHNLVVKKAELVLPQYLEATRDRTVDKLILHQAQRRELESVHRDGLAEARTAEFQALLVDHVVRLAGPNAAGTAAPALAEFAGSFGPGAPVALEESDRHWNRMLRRLAKALHSDAGTRRVVKAATTRAHRAGCDEACEEELLSVLADCLFGETAARPPTYGGTGRPRTGDKDIRIVLLPRFLVQRWLYAQRDESRRIHDRAARQAVRSADGNGDHSERSAARDRAERSARARTRRVSEVAADAPTFESVDSPATLDDLFARHPELRPRLKGNKRRVLKLRLETKLTVKQISKYVGLTYGRVRHINGEIQSLLRPYLLPRQ
ncbi:hypothetical protein ACFL59_15710 [Planctomycetota bacterium]